MTQMARGRDSFSCPMVGLALGFVVFQAVKHVRTLQESERLTREFMIRGAAAAVLGIGIGAASGVDAGFNRLALGCIAAWACLVIQPVATTLVRSRVAN